MDLTAAGFGATVTGVLPELRTMAESLMVDTGSAKRPTGESVQDASTGTQTPTYTTIIASSKCKIQARALVVTTPEVAGRTAAIERLELHLPVGSTALKAGDIWTLTAVGTLSSSRVGRTLRVMGPADKTFQTALRYQVEEIVA